VCLPPRVTGLRVRRVRVRVVTRSTRAHTVPVLRVYGFLRVTTYLGLCSPTALIECRHCGFLFTSTTKCAHQSLQIKSRPVCSTSIFSLREDLNAKVLKAKYFRFVFLSVVLQAQQPKYQPVMQPQNQAHWAQTTSVKIDILKVSKSNIVVVLDSPTPCSHQILPPNASTW